MDLKSFKKYGKHIEKHHESSRKASQSLIRHWASFIAPPTSKDGLRPINSMAFSRELIAARRASTSDTESDSTSKGVASISMIFSASTGSRTSENADRIT